MQSLIAKALRTDLNMSVRISMKAVSCYKSNCMYLILIVITYNVRLRELQYESVYFIQFVV